MRRAPREGQNIAFWQGPKIVSLHCARKWRSDWGFALCEAACIASLQVDEFEQCKLLVK